MEILTTTYKPRNKNIKARDKSVLTSKTNISEKERRHSHLNFMRMSN